MATDEVASAPDQRHHEAQSRHVGGHPYLPRPIVRDQL